MGGPSNYQRDCEDHAMTIRCHNCDRYEGKTYLAKCGRAVGGLYCGIIYERMTAPQRKVERAMRATKRIQERGGCPLGKF